MEELNVVYRLQRYLKQSTEDCKDAIMSGVDTLEKYQYLIGKVQAFEQTLQELSNLLDNKEQMMTKYALQEKYKEEDKKQAEEDKNKVRAENISKELLEKLPTPSGWRILVLPFEPKDKTKGGIIIAQESLDKLRIATNCGYVIKVGPLAYKDENKFYTGPWCKKGDWVIFARYAGSRLPIEGGEVRLLNDDEVLGTIKNPEDILHHI
tara:strand:- start:78 stop:701 length:624 start_codon:yes stop_codon:yes gene_type:complete